MICSMTRLFGPALFCVVETGLVFRAFCTVNVAVKINPYRTNVENRVSS